MEKNSKEYKDIVAKAAAISMTMLAVAKSATMIINSISKARN